MDSHCGSPYINTLIYQSHLIHTPTPPPPPHTHTHTCSQRTVITLIDLLAAVCLVKGGHSKIMEAVDNFKMENGEQLRFEKLVTAFMDHSYTSDFQVGLHCWLDPEST